MKSATRFSSVREGIYRKSCNFVFVIVKCKDIRAFTTRLRQMTSYWAKVCLFTPFYALTVFPMWPDGSKHCFKMIIPYGVAGQKLKVPRNCYEASNFASTSPATMRGTSSRRTAAAMMVCLIAAANHHCSSNPSHSSQLLYWAYPPKEEETDWRRSWGTGV